MSYLSSRPNSKGEACLFEEPYKNQATFNGSSVLEFMIGTGNSPV